MISLGDVYRKRRVLLTGHTGFKGSWLALWLHQLGADVAGLSLAPPTQPNHWDVVALPIREYRVDIRDAAAVAAAVAAEGPDIVFHLAAQSLVRRSYREPVDTWSTNVMGTAHLLEACRHCSSIQAIIVVTSDKCYENRELPRGYTEADPLGGHDPYSASKAAVELLAASYRRSYFDDHRAPLLATVRAGNVIGGGDWSEDRLIPDLVRAVGAGRTLEVRSPGAVRPWQHVLDPLSGYLMLGQRLLNGDRGCEGAWNFGPAASDNRTVADVLDRMHSSWPAVHWQATGGASLHETQLLFLDASKAWRALGWRPIWTLDQALDATADWYRQFLDKGQVISHSQLEQYVADATAPAPN